MPKRTEKITDDISIEQNYDGDFWRIITPRRSWSSKSHAIAARELYLSKSRAIAAAEMLAKDAKLINKALP